MMMQVKAKNPEVQSLAESPPPFSGRKGETPILLAYEAQSCEFELT